MDGKQQRTKSAKAPTSRPQLSHQPQSSPINLPSHRQKLHSTPNSLPSQRPQSHSTNHSFVTTPEYQSSVNFDYDDLTMMPTSSLLNQLLLEKKTSQLRTRQGTKRHVSDFDVHSRPPRTSPSDATPRLEPQRQVSAGLSGSGSSHGKPKEMGAREMMTFIDKIKKENFDLKLQLFHQGQKRASLEQQLEDKIDNMQGLVEENAQLRGNNESLSQEVRRTQQAVDEAVAIICDHEEKLAELGLINDGTRPNTARPGDATNDRPSSRSYGDVTPTTPTRFEVPNRGSSKRATHSGESSRRRSATPKVSTKQARRPPSFLRESNGSSSALRSIYLTEENKSKGAFSVMSMTGSMFLREDADPDTMTMDSPRLSVLSESSFLSVYGSPKHLDLNDPKPGKDDAIFADSPQHQRVHQWIKSREGLTNGERRSNSISTADETVAPIQPTEKSKELAPAASINQPEVHRLPSLVKPPKPYKLDSPSLGGPIFGREVLPPTPDTMSTSNHDTLNRSTSSIIAEKSLADRPQVNGGFADVLPPTERPHTSDGTESRSGAGRGYDEDFDHFSEETEHGRRAGRATFYQSHSFKSGGSSKAIRMLGPGAPSNPRLSCYGGDLMFNGEGIEDVVSSRYISSIRSRSSRDTTQLPLLPVEPTLSSPEEWLAPDPEYVTPEDITPPIGETSRRSSVSSGRVSFSEESKDPHRATFRIRVPSSVQERPPVKRMSLKSRIFSRASSNSGRASDTDSYMGGAAPSPSIRDGRPVTSGSNHRPDNHRRRSSTFFGWMRTGSRDGIPQ